MCLLARARTKTEFSDGHLFLGGLMLDLSIITEEVLVGTEIRSEEDVLLLKDLGVKGVLSLQEESDYRTGSVKKDTLWTFAQGLGMELRNVPVRDFDPPDLIRKLDEAVLELDESIREAGRTYVHCTAGINRSPGVVLAFLVLVKGVSVDSAHHLLKERRPQVNPYGSLVDTLEKRARRGRRIGFQEG